MNHVWEPCLVWESRPRGESLCICGNPALGANGGDPFFAARAPLPQGAAPTKRRSCSALLLRDVGDGLGVGAGQG